MGCCFSSEEDKDYGSADADERTRLLADPVSNNVTPGTTLGEGYHPVQQQQKGDNHQNALDRILHNAARNVIDVAAMDGSTVENHEFYDRSRQYSNTINSRLGTSGRTRSYKQQLPNCSTAPQIVLTAPPVSLSDINLISQVTDRACKAVREVKVDHKEDLVVPFGVP